MKEYLKRILVIVLVLASLFQVALPATYAAQDTEPTGNYEEFNMKKDGSGSGWYSVKCGATTDGSKYIYYLAEKKGSGQRGQFEVEFVGTSHFTDEKGNYLRFYLEQGKVYKYDKSIGMPAKLEEEPVTGLEGLAADMVYGLANGLHLLSSWALGKTLTIDDLVFNKYAETNIAFFTTEKIDNTQKSSLIFGYAGVNGQTKGLHDVVNQWYSIFTKIAFMGYMVILVYMGVRIMFSSTAEQKASYKELFVHWVVGIAILIMFPYVMKYIIRINNAIVKTIEANKGYQSQDPSVIVASINVDAYAMAIEDEVNWGEGTDYMSNIAKMVEGTHRLSLAVAFLIMTWQLIALIVAYFKRLFMVAFLIVIFPLVALSYAVDKVADGKSQAFNTWFKEYLLTVFVQSFHAIIYVFIFSTIYSAAGNQGGEYDFIIVIVGAAFLFNGEQIIRQIFGQVSQAGTMKGLGETAAATYMKMSMVTRAIKKTKDVTIGDKSIAKKTWNYVRGQKAFNAQIAALDNGASDYESGGGGDGEDNHPGDRIEGSPKPPKGNQRTLKSQQDYEKERKYYDAAAILNNPNSHSLADRADALKTLKQLAEENPEHDIFKNNKTKLTANELIDMNGLDEDIQKMVIDGKDQYEIEKHLQMRLGFILQNHDEKFRKQMTDTYMTNLRLNGATSLVSYGDVVREVAGTMNEVNGVQRSFSYVTNLNELNASQVQKMKQLKDSLDAEYSRDNMTDAQKEQLDTVTSAIAVLNNRSGGITHVAALQALDSLRNVNNGGDQYLQDIIRSKLDGDVDVMTHVVARQVATTSAARLREEIDADNDVEGARMATEAQRWARDIVEEYESNPLEGYFADEVSVHEVIAAMTTEGVDEVKDSIEFQTIDSNLTQEDLDQRSVDHLEDTTEIVEAYKGYAEDDVLEEFASSLAILEEMDSGLYNEQEIFEASQVVKKHATESKDLAEIVEMELGHDAQTVATAVAEKIMGTDATAGTTDDSERFYHEQMKASVLDEAARVSLLKSVQLEINTTKLAQIYDGTGDVVNRLYEARTDVMREATSSLAEDYVVENKLDFYAGHVDDQPTINGYTRDELEIMRRNESLKFLSSLVPFKGQVTDDNGGANAWLTNWEYKKYLLEKDEERTGVLSSWEDMRKLRKNSHGVMTEIEDRRRRRQINRDANYYGDIRDWEELRNKDD